MSKFHRKPNLYLGEVSLKVRDMNRSLAFYQKMIGLKVLEKDGNQAVLSADGKTPLVILEQLENMEEKLSRTAGLYHFAILLPSRRALSVFLRHLLETGYPFGAADHLVSEALYLNDIDGNGIEVYADRPSEEWKWKNGLILMDTLELDGAGILAETSDPWEGLPPGTIMGHIHLHVSDLEKAKEFYTKGLGYSIVSYYPRAIFMSTGGYHHHIAINTWQGVGIPGTAKNHVGMKWYRIFYPDEETRKETIGRLESMDVKVSKQGEDYFTADPSGNGIRLSLSWE